MKTCGKITAEMGRQHHEGLPVAVECKGMEEASRGQGYLEAHHLTGQGMMCAVTPLEEEEAEEREEKEEEGKEGDKKTITTTIIIRCR
jgi:hypothetical protein